MSESGLQTLGLVAASAIAVLRWLAPNPDEVGFRFLADVNGLSIADLWMAAPVFFHRSTVGADRSGFEHPEHGANEDGEPENY